MVKLHIYIYYGTIIMSIRRKLDMTVFMISVKEKKYLKKTRKRYNLQLGAKGILKKHR